MKDERVVTELRDELTTIKRLVAALVGPELKLAERAPLLHRLGVDRATIAVVCNTTPETVSVRVAESRRGGRGTRRAANHANATTEATV